VITARPTALVGAFNRLQLHPVDQLVDDPHQMLFWDQFVQARR